MAGAGLWHMAFSRFAGLGIVIVHELACSLELCLLRRGWGWARRKGRCNVVVRLE